uniref:Uncharacterized protein n=1 Tax=Amphiprion ocellaris TaxID=80972 RepID=A0A3Q1BG07_AMPOC
SPAPNQLFCIKVSLLIDSISTLPWGCVLVRGAHLLLHKSFEPYLPLSGEMRACCSFSPMMKAFSEFHSNRSSHRLESKFLHYPKICVIGFLHVPWVQIQLSS